MKILHGDVIDQLKTISAQSINCVITSPPYFGLRNYGLPPTKWAAVSYSPMAGLPEIMVPEMTCCLGLEDSIEAYVGHLLLIFRELWRVLREDGTAWLNLGDSYYGSQMRGGTDSKEGIGKLKDRMFDRPMITSTLKPKNLMAIPWRVALALQAEGWYLRSDIIWAKKNCLPESVRDRPTKSHEYVFLLSKSKKYWYDQEAIRESQSNNSHGGQGVNANWKQAKVQDIKSSTLGKKAYEYNPSGRNARTVWNIATSPFKEAHFAVFPPALVEKCLLAGCPSRICVECGEPWVRVVEKTPNNDGYPNGPGGRHKEYKKQHGNLATIARYDTKTIGFTPACQCNGHFEDQVIENYYDWQESDVDKKKVVKVYIPHIPLNRHPWRPGIVLDPFFGSGTTGVVAEQLGRDWIGIDLNPEYVEMAKQRLIKTQPVLPGIY